MKNKKMFKLVLFALLAALDFAVMFVHIPLPVGGMIHLGNLVCVLTALLIGGFYGGLVGSLGMGLSDIINPKYITTAPRTIILKFLMGLIAGLLFRYLNKKGLTKHGSNAFLISLSLAFKLVFAVTLLMYLNPEWFIKNDKMVSVNLLIPISIILFSLLFDAALLFLRKRTAVYHQVLISVSTATIFNIFAEFIIKLIQHLILGEGFDASLVQAVFTLPASAFTGLITIVGSTLLFLPVNLALKDKYKDVLGECLDDKIIARASKKEDIAE